MLSRYGDMMNVRGGTENWRANIGVLSGRGGCAMAGRPA
jgi:hypothetical protein